MNPSFQPAGPRFPADHRPIREEVLGPPLPEWLLAETQRLFISRPQARRAPCLSVSPPHAALFLSSSMAVLWVSARRSGCGGGIVFTTFAECSTRVDVDRCTLYSSTRTPCKVEESQIEDSSAARLANGKRSDWWRPRVQAIKVGVLPVPMVVATIASSYGTCHVGVRLYMLLRYSCRTGVAGRLPFVRMNGLIQLCM